MTFVYYGWELMKIESEAHKPFVSNVLFEKLFYSDLVKIWICIEYPLTPSGQRRNAERYFKVYVCKLCLSFWDGWTSEIIWQFHCLLLESENQTQQIR